MAPNRMVSRRSVGESRRGRWHSRAIGHGASGLVPWGARLVRGVGALARTGGGRGRGQGVVSADVSWAGMRSFRTRGARGLSRTGVRSSEHESDIGGCVQPNVIVVGVEGGRVSGGVDLVLV